MAGAYESDFYAVVDDSERGVVLLRRSAARFPSAAALTVETRSITAVFDQLGRESRGLVVDVRQAPTSTESTMEPIFAAHRSEIQKGFRRVAIVVRTAAGRLQANRLIREDRRAVETFTDEEAAIRHVAGG